jgi:hypothetical protein
MKLKVLDLAIRRTGNVTRLPANEAEEGNDMKMKNPSKGIFGGMSQL